MKSLTLTFILVLNLLAYSQGGSIQEVYLGTTFYVGVPKSSSIIFRLTGLENPIPNNGAIKISFPTGFTLPAQMSVSPVSGIGSGAYVQVTSRDVVIRNGSTYSQSSIIVGLYATQGGILASTNNTGTLEVETLDAAGNVIDTNRNGAISILPTTLRALSINSSNDTTSAISTLRVEFNTTNSVPASTSIKMRIPIANPLAPTDLQSYVLTNLTSCINRTGEPQDLDCEFSNGWLVIKNAFPQGTSQSTHFVFEVQDIKNPNSVSSMSGFEVYLCSNDELNFYEQATNGVLAVNTPATVQNLNVTSSTKVVYTMTNLTVEVLPNGFINPNSSVRIRFPDDLSLRESVRILGGRNTKQGQLNYTLTGQTIQLNQVFDTYFQDDSFSFSVQNIRNPARTTSDLVFQVQITDESSFTINQGSVNTTYETVNGIYIRNITTNNRVVSTQATYVFEIGFDMPPSLGDIEVIFPEEISLQFSNDNLCTALTGINTGAYCTVEAGKAIFHDVFPLRGSDTTMSFSIGNVLNPTSTEPTGSFRVQTVRDDQVLQASEGNFSITAISSELTVNQIQFVNPTVATSGSLLTSLTTTSPVLAASFIEFDLGSLDISRAQCQGIVGIPFSASCQLEQGKLTLRNGITTDRVSGSQFTLVIGGVASPRSVQPVCGLTATIKAQDGSVITETHENLCVDASKEAAISSDISALVSTLNQDVDLRFELTVQNTIEPDDVLSIKIPSELSWSAENTTIKMITPYEQELVIADITGDTADIPLSFTIARAELITLEVEKIVNNQLNNSIQGFEFTVASKDGFAVAKGVNNVTILFQNTTANNLTEIECSSTKVGAVAAYNVTFPSGFSLRQIGGVYIDFPSSFLLLQDNCLIANTPGECSRVSRTSVYLTNFQGNISPEELMVNIPAVQNALSNQEPLESLTFEIKDLRNQTTELRQAAFSFNLECDVGCSLCDGSASLCLSCTEGYELLENTCIPLCPLGSGRSGSTCRACTESRCMECYGSWDQCNMCEPGYQLESGKCVDEDEVSNFSEKETDGISPYFLVIIILFAFCTAVALLIWFRRHYLSLKGILLSIYSPLDLLCLAFLSYYVSTFAQPIEFIIIGFLWLIHIGLQVYGALKLLRLIKNPDKLPQPMPVYYYASTFIDIRIITYYLSVLNNLVIDLKETRRREISYKYLVIFTISSLKSLFITVFCFSILSESTRISRDSVFFFCEYGAFSVILTLLTLILLFGLLRDVIERRPYQRPFTMEKQFVVGQEQSQENSAGFKGSPARKDNRFLNAAKTLAKDLDFTTLRKKFGRDFSEIRKLLTFDTTKRGSFMDAKRLRSEDRDYRQAPEFEEFTLKAFSEDPNKRRRERNSLFISDFQADKTEADEVKSSNTIMTMKYVSPQVGQNGEEEEAHLKNKVNSFQTKLSMYSFS